MDRRNFVKGSLLTLAGSMLPVKSNSYQVQYNEPATVAPTNKLKGDYIREKIPSFEIPPYRGQWYTDTIPDTLDLAERVKLGVHGITAIADPRADYEIFWLADYFRNPPILLHDFSDWCQNVEGLMEALPLLRGASGSELNHQVDPVWMSTLLKSIGPDGLVYCPLNGFPWDRLNTAGIDPVWRSDGSKTSSKDASVSQVANGCTCQRAIGTMTVYYLRDKNPMWKTTIEKMIQRLTALTIDRGDYVYFPAGGFEPNAKIDPHAEMPLGAEWGVTWNTRAVQPLAQYYKVTGYEPALQLAKKLTQYTRFHGQIFDPDGRWILDAEIKGKGMWQGKYNVEGLTLGGHGHGHGIAMVDVLEYGLVAADKDSLQFSKANYEWARNPGSEYGVSSLVGWFPEWYVPNYPACESCTVGDMLAMAVKLSEAGVGDYWDDVDRWVRNHFAEAQLTKADWIYGLAERQHRKPVAFNETADHAPERSIGAWSGWAGASEWVTWIGIQGCCTGNAPRGLYYVWEHMVDHSEDQVRVNLLLNRASRWVDVYSYVPYEGRVELKVKAEQRGMLLRAPEWVETHSPQIVCKVNGAPRSLHWEGRYVNTGAVKPGDRVVLTFPISERTVKENIGGATYTLVMRGNTVVSIDPLGPNGPLYQDREKYRKSEVARVQVKRFVPEQEIIW